MAACSVVRRLVGCPRWHGGQLMRQQVRRVVSTQEPEILKHQILAETTVSRDHLTPELALHLITPACHLWRAPPHLSPFPDPFWAFYWPGGQAVSRFILDNPAVVKGKTVLDFGCGCGASGLAAKSAGAKRVTFNDIDEVAMEALQLNAGVNKILVDDMTTTNLVGSAGSPHQVVLAGDLLYDSKFAGEVLTWLQQLNRSGSLVLIGDPGRFALESHPLKASLQCLAKYELAATTLLENSGHPQAFVWTFS
ncbi:electron transfer flavoprotein beta subunit lysine methyltransferase-like [Portunus trituberculatus]|uniref:ETFB lysine methyltransferase n=1 Tax=Portunus trituberculatus TaxID=210409 RepID=A0A5B7E0S2_PORTR|nr:electron transfer flavoprotein beta subunit lysine methyltransferase-like [Portunus trituberculatus]XP_045113829.1 electron transfer flavoprotein beta subunit lysine methyltransferase-like [Portunus trituberculatus]XP_045113830.1 electron transfer flavoprotein beta subunit lysine methyltransferase-like [Portunus trituberculatus]MPC26793.1 Electron transfer flavoprotein beta subunit lysine methyltransferase [Portunus trituberculatus]